MLALNKLVEFLGSIDDPCDVSSRKYSTPSISELLLGHLLVPDHDHGDLAPGLAGVQHLGGGRHHLRVVQVHHGLHTQGY